VKLSNDKNCMLVASLDNTIRLLDKETGELLTDYTGHRNSEYRTIPEFTSKDSHVICGSEDGKIYIWDLVESTMDSPTEAHTGVVTSITYHPSQNHLLSTSFDSTVKLWAVTFK
jgi:mitogen-activated protein kinase organizer 1